MNRRTELAMAAAIAAAIAGAWVAIGIPGPEVADSAIVRLAVSPSGRWVAGGTKDGRITLWDASRSAVAARFRAAPGALNDLRFSPDDRWLAVANRNLEMHPLPPGVPPRRLRADARNYGSAAFSAGGRMLLTITGDGALEMLDAVTGRGLVRACCSTIYSDVALAPDGTYFASAGHRPSLWNARTGELIAHLTGERDAFASGPLAFDAGRNLLFTGSQEGVIRAWDLGARRLAAVSPRSAEWVTSMALDAATGNIVFAGSRGTVRLWDMRAGTVRVVRGALAASNVAPAPGGNIILGTRDGAVETWNAYTDTRAAVMR